MLRPFLAILCVLAACSRGGGSSAPVQPSPDIIGVWDGGWTSTRVTRSGTLVLEFLSTGASVAGNGRMTNSPCFSVGAFSGTQNGLNLFLSAVAAGGAIDFSASVDEAGTIMLGDYTVLTGSCAGDSGRWSARKRP